MTLVTIRNYATKKIKNNLGFMATMICILVIKTTLADHYHVPTGSMIPTIAIGDNLFTNKIAYDLKLPFTKIILKKLGEPERGDIIVFDYPKDPSISYIKRLIAIPGDRVEIINGFVKINGKLTLKNPEELQKIIGILNSETEEVLYTEEVL